jgi:DNA-binding transcriptional LysR family regulator
MQRGPAPQTEVSSFVDIERLNLRKLRTFYLAARQGGLRPAASKLKITASAVSFSIRSLEEELGVQLFQRLPNRLVLTAVGERLAQSAEAIFEGIDKVITDSRLEGMPRGRISIAVNSDLASYFRPKIADFLKLYPDIELGIYIRGSAETLRAVERGEIDIGIGRFGKVPKRLEHEPLIDSSVALVCRQDHALAGRRTPRLEQIARYRLVSPIVRNISSKRTIDAAFAKYGVAPSSFIEAGNCHTACEFVEAGIGVGLVHSFCAHSAASAHLHVRELNRYFGIGTFSAIYQKAGSRPAIFQIVREALLVSSKAGRYIS